MIDDEKDKHLFYSDWGVKQHEKRKRELEKEEKETAKINARKASGKTPTGPMEEGSSGESGEQMRMVRSDGVPELPSHNRKAIPTTKNRLPQRTSTMPKVSQVRHRNVRTRKSNKSGNVVVL